MCDKTVNKIQYVQSKKSCSKCLDEPRYMMEVEWDSNGTDIDYDIWMHDDFFWIVEKATNATLKRFDTSIGSCPDFKVISFVDTHGGLNLTKSVRLTIKYNINKLTKI